MTGKGSNRRREDTAKVEANWPTEWNARERGIPLDSPEGRELTRAKGAHMAEQSRLIREDMGREHG